MKKSTKTKRIVGQGNTASQIAEIIGGISRNAVIGKALRLNLSAKIKHRTSRINKNYINKSEKNIGRGRKSKFRSLIIDKNFEPAKNLTLEELTDETCKYMEGHPDEKSSSFCGRKTVEKFSYCLFI